MKHLGQSFGGADHEVDADALCTPSYRTETFRVLDSDVPVATAWFNSYETEETPAELEIAQLLTASGFDSRIFPDV